MAFAYCSKCEHPLDYPSNKEIIESSIGCPVMGCAGKYELDKTHFIDLILTILERLERLEERFK